VEEDKEKKWTPPFGNERGGSQVKTTGIWMRSAGESLQCLRRQKGQKLFVQQKNRRKKAREGWKRFFCKKNDQEPVHATREKYAPLRRRGEGATCPLEKMIEDWKKKMGLVQKGLIGKPPRKKTRRRKELTLTSRGPNWPSPDRPTDVTLSRKVPWGTEKWDIERQGGKVLPSVEHPHYLKMGKGSKTKVRGNWPKDVAKLSCGLGVRGGDKARRRTLPDPISGEGKSHTKRKKWESLQGAPIETPFNGSQGAETASLDPYAARVGRVQEKKKFPRNRKRSPQKCHIVGG